MKSRSSHRGHRRALSAILERAATAGIDETLTSVIPRRCNAAAGPVPLHAQSTLRGKVRGTGAVSTDAAMVACAFETTAVTPG